MTSTRWGERHAYAAAATGNKNDIVVSRQAKALHPFPLCSRTSGAALPAPVATRPEPSRPAAPAEARR